MSSLDRNHDGKIDARDLAPNAGVANATVVAAPAKVEVIEKNVVVQ